MKTVSVGSYARVLERIEIIRSSLRWKTNLDQAGIQNILIQVNKLRDDILFLSRAERYREQRDSKSSPAPITKAQRRQALLESDFVFEGIFGDNPKLLETLETVEKAAPTDLPILIEGESGTGKELLAKVIHANSARSERPFISINCGAIPADLIESDLFGHVKGAFTGSIKDRKGKFEAAHNGTIFLDEISELSADHQVKLLRVLQTGEIQRVGADQPIAVNTRVVAATNRNLSKMMEKGNFREDLYYRLGVIGVTLPPLRERRDEIPLLIDYFSTEAAEKLKRKVVRLSPQLRYFLENYSYRGNIRELQNIIYRISCLAEYEADLINLPDTIRPVSTDTRATDENATAVPLTLEKARKSASEHAEKQFLERGLREVNGNVTQLAKRLKLNRSYLQTLLKKRGLRAKDFK